MGKQGKGKMKERERKSYRLKSEEGMVIEVKMTKEKKARSKM